MRETALIEFPQGDQDMDRVPSCPNPSTRWREGERRVLRRKKNHCSVSFGTNPASFSLPLIYFFILLMKSAGILLETVIL